MAPLPFFLAAALATAPVLAAQSKPDVVIVIWDTTRAGHLTPYGYSRDTTPNLNAIAKGGVVFERAFASGSWTGASVPSLFTGLFGHNHEVDYATKNWALDLRPEAVTLAEAFKQAGYATALYTAQGVVQNRKGLQQGFDDTRKSGEPVLVDRALEFIDNAGDTPAFVVVYYTNPHAPYLPRPEHDLWRDKSKPPMNIVGCDEKSEEKAEGGIRWCDVNWGKVTLTPGNYQQLRDGYDGELHQNDADLGKLWAGLKTRGIQDSTIFAMTSDHGEAFGDHKGAETWHTLPYWYNQNVPLIIRYPKGLKAGRVKTQVRGVDLYPTVLDLAGLTVDHPINGTSLKTWTSGGKPDLVNIGFSHNIGYYNNGRYRLILSRTNQTMRELYDVQADPKEQTNLAETQPDLFAKVLAEMDAFVKETSISLGGEATPATDEDHEMLKALGYVE